LSTGGATLLLLNESYYWKFIHDDNDVVSLAVMIQQQRPSKEAILMSVSAVNSMLLKF